MPSVTQTALSKVAYACLSCKQALHNEGSVCRGYCSYQGEFQLTRQLTWVWLKTELKHSPCFPHPQCTCSSFCIIFLFSELCLLKNISFTACFRLCKRK